MDVFQKFYVQLVQTLPMNDAIFIAQLFSCNLFPGNLMEEIRAKPTAADKTTHFLDYGIKPGLRNGNRKLFEDLLLVMNESDNPVIIQLAKEINGKCCNV